jgi:hypothetical protein
MATTNRTVSTVRRVNRGLQKSTGLYIATPPGDQMIFVVGASGVDVMRASLRMLAQAVTSFLGDCRNDEIGPGQAPKCPKSCQEWACSHGNLRPV